jgi:hypothetical protein
LAAPKIPRTIVHALINTNTLARNSRNDNSLRLFYFKKRRYFDDSSADVEPMMGPFFAVDNFTTAKSLSEAHNTLCCKTLST